MLKKYLKKVMSLSLVALSLAVIIPKAAHAEWRQNNTGWWYTAGNSWDTGWKYINQQWYYFYPNGYMAADTIIDGYYLNNNGEWVNNSPLYNYNNMNINPSNYINTNIVPSANYSDKKTKPSQHYTNINNRPSSDHHDTKTRTSQDYNDVKTRQSQDYISKEKIKEIVLNHAGISADAVRHMNAEFDYENGNPIYEVDFKVGYMEYEYDIDATTGKIINYNNEYDD